MEQQFGGNAGCSGQRGIWNTSVFKSNLTQQWEVWTCSSYTLSSSWYKIGQNNQKIVPSFLVSRLICLRDSECLHFSLSVSNALVLRPSEQYWELEAFGALKVPSSVSDCISFPANKSSPKSAVIPRDTFVCPVWNKPLALISFQWG